MLQTLVENAIKHGISKQVRGGVVHVSSNLHRGVHIMCVRNTGSLHNDRAGGGFGLSSTQDRLSLLYGGRARFEIKEVADELVEATVKIPVSQNQPVFN